MKTKKLALLYILEILKANTNEDYPLLQREISDILSEEYGIDLEYKTMSANIKTLIEEGLIETNGKKQGCYFDDRLFEDSELQLLIHSVLCNNYIPASQSKDLIERISKLSSRFFRPIDDYVNMIDSWQKSNNQELFLNIELISEAIRKRKQIKYDYNAYKIGSIIHKADKYIVSPYTMFINNQKYYLLAYDEKNKNIIYHRLDLIKNLEIINKEYTKLHTIKGFERGINYNKLSSTLPEYYFEKETLIELEIKEDSLEKIYDKFGSNVDIKQNKNKTYNIIINTNPSSIKYWALENINDIKVIKPLELKKEILNILKENISKYEEKGGK